MNHLVDGREQGLAGEGKFEEVSFDGLFEWCYGGTRMDVNGDGIQEGGCSNWERPVTPGMVLSPDGLQSVCAGAGGPETMGWVVEGEEVWKVGRGQVV